MHYGTKSLRKEMTPWNASRSKAQLMVLAKIRNLNTRTESEASDDKGSSSS